jgi:hypothetical protein
MPPVVVTHKFPPPPLQTPFFAVDPKTGQPDTNQISQAWAQWLQKIATTLSP